MRKIGVTSALILAVLVFHCQGGFKKEDPILEKDIEQLTDQDVSRMVVVTRTNYGGFTFELRPDWAPKTCRHFIKQVKTGAYIGQAVNEIRPNFWMVIGDPDEKPELTGNLIGMEKSSGTHEKYAVGLFHPDYRLDQGGSRFYVMLGHRPDRDSGYTTFGKLIKGQAAIDRIGALEVTCRICKPKAYLPLRQVKILDLHLEVRGE